MEEASPRTDRRGICTRAEWSTLSLFNSRNRGSRCFPPRPPVSYLVILCVLCSAILYTARVRSTHARTHTALSTSHATFCRAFQTSRFISPSFAFHFFVSPFRFTPPPAFRYSPQAHSPHHTAQFIPGRFVTPHPSPLIASLNHPPPTPFLTDYLSPPASPSTFSSSVFRLPPPFLLARLPHRHRTTSTPPSTPPPPPSSVYPPHTCYVHLIACLDLPLPSPPPHPPQLFLRLHPSPTSTTACARWNVTISHRWLAAHVRPAGRRSKLRPSHPRTTSSRRRSRFRRFRRRLPHRHHFRHTSPTPGRSHRPSHPNRSRHV